MRVAVLMENSSRRAELNCAHGLSLFIESVDVRVLFDSGPDGRFMENAAAMDIDLSKADLAFLSHGHRDHGGGLGAFLERNSRAPVLVAEGTFGDYRAMSPKGEVKPIGLDTALIGRFQSRFFGGAEGLPSGLMALGRAAGRTLEPLTNENLKVMREGVLTPDDFSHEQSLLVSEAETLVLFAGCAHRGIVNIMDEAERAFGRIPDFCFGGFHLHSWGTGAEEPPERLAALGKELASRDTVYITGHCTGKGPYAALKEMLGERLLSMSTGDVFEIRGKNDIMREIGQ